MPRTIFHPDSKTKPRAIGMIEQGGTNATTAPQALINLGALSMGMIGQPNNAIPVREDGSIDPAYFSGLSFGEAAIDGKLSMVVGETAEFYITTYDAFTEYTIEPISGEASCEGSIITYSAPSTAGIGGFKINGRIIAIQVKQNTVAKPSIVSPVNGAANLTVTPTITSLPYAVIGNTGSHAASDWQFSYSPDFISIEHESVNDAVNLTSYTFSAKELKTYYVRVRYRSIDGKISDWSSGSMFKTDNDGILNNENQLILKPSLKPDILGASSFGFNVQYSQDGTTLYASAHREKGGSTGFDGVGALFIFKKDPTGLWAFNSAIYPPAADEKTSLFFGSSFAVSDDGNTLLIGACSEIDKDGRIYFYRLVSGNWILTQTIASPNQLGRRFAWKTMTVSDDGLEFVVSDITQPKSGTDDIGKVYQYLRTGNVWALNQTIDNVNVTVGVDELWFGYSVKMSKDRQKLLVSCPCGNSSSKAGFINEYTKVGNGWQLTSQIPSPALPPDSQFGFHFSTSDDFSLLAVSAYNAAKVFIYRKVGSTWTYETTFTDPTFYKTVGVFLSKNAEKLYVSTSLAPGVYYRVLEYTYQNSVWAITNSFVSKTNQPNELFGTGFGNIINPVYNELAIVVPGFNAGVGAIAIFN